ncbi:hypothetical protein LB505_000754 [Fusarium chuoi]|nr:hypothetical protein LB505_000754 [Fusarium chuoi]
MLQRSGQNINGFKRLQRNLLGPRDIHLRPLPRLTSPCKPASIKGSYYEVLPDVRPRFAKTGNTNNK